MSDATDQHAASADPADQHAATAGPVVDEDLLTMMGDVLSAHNGADVEPDPAAVWQSLVSGFTTKPQSRRRWRKSA